MSKKQSEEIKKSLLDNEEHTEQLTLFEEGESFDNTPINKKKNKEKVTKPKLSKFEKRRIKRKRQEDLLNLRGIPKYYVMFIVETMFIFITELLVKLLLGNFVFDWTLLRIFLSSSIIGFFVTLMTTNMPLVVRRGVSLIINSLIVFYAWLQLGFMNFLGAFMSVGNAEQGTKITDYIFEFLSAYSPTLHLIYIPFVLFVLYIIFERYITKDGFSSKLNFKNVLTNIAMVIFACLMVLLYYVSLEVGFMQNKYQVITNRELFKYPSNPSYAIKNFGTTVYVFLDIKSAILGGEHLDIPTEENPEEPDKTDNSRNIDDTAWESLIKIEEDPGYSTLNSYFINKPIAEKNDYTGIFEGKNLIMIMLESIGYGVFSEEYKEYFPTLYKLYSEGMSATNHYSPRNNCGTGESEMMSQISIYPVGTTCTVNTYKDNVYRQALMQMFKGEDYYTSAYHDYTDLYYSRSIYEINMGNSIYFGVDKLGVSYDHAYKEWPSDLEFFEKAVPKFIDQEKFASYMITVTAHTPYIFSSKMGDKHLDLFKDLNLPIQAKRYLSKVKEDDLALEYLLKTLEEKGILEDTVLVLFGDHYPYGLTDKIYQSIANYDLSVGNEVDRTPFIIYNSETEPEVIEKYMTPMDYVPTILNMFGIEHDPRHYFGHDIWSEYRDYVVYSDNSWQNASGFYDSQKGEFIPTEGEEILTDKEIISINQEINDMKNMSALTIKKDYFNYLYKYFDEYEALKEKQEEENKKDMEED